MKLNHEKNIDNYIEVIKEIGNKKKVEEYIKQGYDIKNVVCFFDNENFLATEYIPLNNGVHLIIELNKGVELHFDDCSCGYNGTGSRNSEIILKLFNVPEYLIDMLFYKDTVMFHKLDGKYSLYKFDFSQIYCSSVRAEHFKFEYQSMIQGKNLLVNYNQREIKLYNPQRNSLVGFLRLINILKIRKIEYYLGKNSPLENNYTISNYEEYDKDIDVKGINSINLVLYSRDYKIICLVDTEEIISFVDLIYYNLTGEYLFLNEEKKILLGKDSIFNIFNKNKVKEMKNRVYIKDIKND